MTPYAAVIGDPIAQSKSPLIHRFWLDALGIDADYRRVHVTPDALTDYIARSKDDPDWRGCNVTIPHKIAVMDLVSDPGDVRTSIGAMNTVVRAADGALVGTNTDAGGFAAPLAERDLADRDAVVIGAGGAARAVLAALAQRQVGRVTILNRSTDKAAALLDRYGLQGEAVPLDAPLPSTAALVVNTSALGMIGQPPLDLDLSPLDDQALVYDIVYAPLETSLLARARARGMATVDGLEMLIGQAALAFALFFGAEPPRERDAELRALLTA